MENIPNKNKNIEVVSNWWGQAKADFRKAEILLKNNQFDGAVFYSHQSVEKGLKSLYIQKFKKNPEKTHDLTYLSDLLKLPEKFRDLAANLTPAYMFSRYPDVIRTIPARFYSKNKAIEIFNLAKEALEWLRKDLEI